MILAYYGDTPRTVRLMGGTKTLSGVVNLTSVSLRNPSPSASPLPLGYVYMADWIYDTKKQHWLKHRGGNPTDMLPMSDKDLAFNLLAAKELV